MSIIKTKSSFKSKEIEASSIAVIIQVVTLILQLILSGMNESEAIKIASTRHNLPILTVKKIWKKYK